MLFIEDICFSSTKHHHTPLVSFLTIGMSIHGWIGYPPITASAPLKFFYVEWNTVNNILDSKMHFVDVVLITNVCYTLASLPLNTVWRFIYKFLSGLCVCFRINWSNVFRSRWFLQGIWSKFCMSMLGCYNLCI